MASTDMPVPKNLLIRCDATVETGLGHLSRCLALAEGFVEIGWACTFLGRFEPGARTLITGAEMACLTMLGADELDETRKAIEASEACAMVVDSYDVTDSYIVGVEAAGVPVLVIDDFGKLARYECAGILNFTVRAEQVCYPRRDQLFLLGPEYLLVRRCLRDLRSRTRPRSGEVRRVLIAMGGVDADDLSGRVVRTVFEQAPQVAVSVVVGAAYAHLERLSSVLAANPGDPSVSVQVRDMAGEFSRADACLCAGGLTKYEAVYLGIPAAVVSQNEPQAEDTRVFAQMDLVLDCGLAVPGDEGDLPGVERLLRDKHLRADLSKRGLEFFPNDPTRQAVESFARHVSR